MMRADDIKRYALLLAAAALTAIMLSLAFAVPYVWVGLGFAAWLFIGRLVTMDDHFPGGWSNPRGVKPMPLIDLCIKGVIFLTFAIAATSPEINQWGR